jgi:hypothetical protein
MERSWAAGADAMRARVTRHCNINGNNFPGIPSDHI